VHNSYFTNSPIWYIKNAIFPHLYSTFWYNKDNEKPECRGHKPMKNIKIEFTNERIIPASGLAIVGAILGKSDFVKHCNRMDVTKNRSQHQIKNGDILLTCIGLLTMGKPAYESVHEFDDDQEFYKYALGITRSIPSEETLHQRMDDIEANTWWTNLGMNDHDVIWLYHAHGECEQFHSEIKTDMDLERLPSGKFSTNELVMELAIIACNILRMIGQESIGRRGTETKHKVRRRRLRTVIGNMIMMASHVTKHARQLITGLGRSNTWRFAFREVYTAFADFYA